MYKGTNMVFSFSVLSAVLKPLGNQFCCSGNKIFQYMFPVVLVLFAIGKSQCKERRTILLNIVQLKMFYTDL